MADSTLDLQGSGIHVLLTQDQLLAFTTHIQATSPGRPTEEFVTAFMQRLYTAQAQTFSQVMQEFQLGQKPSARAPIDLGENQQEQGCVDDPNVRVDEEDNKWLYAKPAVYVARGVQTEEALNLIRKPHHRGKRGGGKNKKRQVTTADSNINEASARSTVGKETVEAEISQVETQDVVAAPAVSNTGKCTTRYDVSNIETAGIHKTKRNRHEPKPPAVFVDYFLDRWIESLRSATAGQQDKGENSPLTIRPATIQMTECDGNPNLNR